MLRRASCNPKRLFHGVHRVLTESGKPNYQKRIAVITALGVVVGGGTVCYNSGLIHNDVSVAPQSTKESKSAPTVQENIHQSNTLHSLVWGSNSGGALVPGAPEGDPIRKPTIAGWLEGVALRDLGLLEKHAACVDARGDVYQWGDGFNGKSSSAVKSPKRTLRGKNIVQLQLTDEKVYALSASGRVYILASSAERQVPHPGAPTLSSDAWWGTGWLWGEQTTVDFTEVSPAAILSWGEKFTAIAAGKNHILALTSKGRVFAHPVNKFANNYGQLGLRKVYVSEPSLLEGTKTSPIEVELIPKSLADPYVNASRAVRAPPTPFRSENLANINDSDIRFCTKLFEVPVLRGVEAAQIAAGSRTSFLRTKTGRVLAWGANDFGQLGLGSHVSLDTVTVPTEVVLWRFVPSNTESKCLSVSAGGDLTAFVVERKGKDHPTTDLLMSGNGQYGGLGNTAYLNSQGEPTRVRGISGFLQYNEITKGLEAIKPVAVSISPTGHVLVSLNSAKNSGVGGNDLMFWGKNYDSESGNGKKASIALPMAVESEGERVLLVEKRAKEVKDLEGKVWKRGVRVEQRPVAGYQNSVVYWKIV